MDHSDSEPEQLVSLHGDEAENLALATDALQLNETAPADLPNPEQLLAKIRIRLPPHLKQSHTDALIIHAERDEVHAAALKRAIDGVVVCSTSSGDDVRGSATLVDDAAAYVTSHVDWLQQALAQHTYVFVVFTAHLLADARLKTMADASFWETVSGNRDKRCCFVPAYVIVGPQELQLSPYFRQLTGIYMDQTGSWQSRRLENTIRARIGDKRKRSEAQKEEQKRHVGEACPDLYRLWMDADFPDLLSGD